MERKYSKYIDDYMKGELKDEHRVKLLEHAEVCSDCSKKIKIIDSIDKTIFELLEDLPYKSRKNEIITAAESDNKMPVKKIIYNYQVYFCAAALILALLVSIKAYKFIINYRETTSYTSDPISYVLRLQEQHVTAAPYSKYTNFLVHSGYYYVPTGESINREKIDKFLGKVASAVYITGNKLFLTEGDSAQYNYSNKYYSIKGISDSKKIACEDKQSLKLPAARYIVLERRDHIEAPDTQYLFSTKGNEEECDIAIKNIAKYVPFFYTFNVDELKPFIVYVQTETGNIDEKENGTGYILVNYMLKNTSVKTAQVYLRISEGQHNLNDMCEFSYSPNPVISSFELNGIVWREYNGINGNTIYFKGVKGNVVYEVGSRLSSEKVRQYLNGFARPAEK